MKFNNSLPIYKQVIDKFKADIISGRVKLGDKMPSTRDLAKELGINPNTATRIYKEMESQGICYKKRGLGTFITESAETVNEIKVDMANRLTADFVQGMIKLGISYEEMVSLVLQKKAIMLEDYNE
ncbi:GntR family transcriptional regulator [Clostridium sp. 'deep sea']|uniref:GntR family transcriptional regulator n=1 Tax=Clostridium sp. 'deep sea' TaxID=2779445 RepID=UPI0018965351|nr:GntR family transcriptional regulator [Clostridium sp. 'deep sea']QOR35269.1 GntR family transcriptional regulator [Clostridium sp. 'deep sea']